MTKDIEVSTRVKGEVSIIDIKGEVTTLTGQTVEDTYKEMSKAGAKKILLYFDEKGYINSGGIAILIGMVSESRKKGQVIRITLDEEIGHVKDGVFEGINNMEV